VAEELSFFLRKKKFEKNVKTRITEPTKEEDI
jgi:hypothetical protein